MSINLLIGIGCTSFGILGVFITVIGAILSNWVLYGGSNKTLLLLFIFLGNYSLVWGGEYGFMSLNAARIDVNLTRSSNFLGYFLVAGLIQNKVRFPKINGLDLGILIFYLLTVLNIVISDDNAEPEKMARRFIQFIILYSVIRVLLRGKSDFTLYFRFIMTTFLILFIAITVQFLVQFFWGGAITRPHILASFLPYLLAFASYTPRNKRIWHVLATFSAFTSFFSASRRVFMAVIGYIILHFTNSLKNVIFLLFIVLLLPVLYDFVPVETRQRLDYTFRIVEQSGEDGLDDSELSELTSHRTDFWLVSFKMFLDYPIMGIGIKNQEKYMVEYGAIRNARAHNFYVEILADMGLVGLSVFIIIIVSTFKLLNQSVRILKFKSGYLKVMILAFRNQMIIIHVVALFGSSMLYSRNLWILYALVASIAEMSRRNHSSSH